jgi:hypothetical protein
MVVNRGGRGMVSMQGGGLTFSLDKPWPRIFESRPDLRSKKYTPLNPLRDPLGQI